MTLYDFGTNTAQKRQNMVAILKFKMAAEDAFEKNGTNTGFVRKGIRMQKKPWFHKYRQFCTGLHNPMHYLLSFY